jgi:serine/threonine protein kinase
MTLEQGNVLHGRYRILDILGQGGMGSVYRAIDENLGVEVAVKENLFTTDEYARQFRLEAVILASLRHPNLPRVTDHFVVGQEGQYLVMDYIEGEDLRQRMERIGTIPDEEAILIGAAMCDAIAYLHTRKPPVLHRDIKPGNVKITPEGQVYLVDFGLAKVVRGTQATTTGARAMTPGYSPPEQYGTARTDPRSDIYSLGATLYAALTGNIPEDGLARVMDNVELTPLRKRNSKVSRKLAAAIEKAMQSYPDDRFQSGEEFKEALLIASAKTQHLVNMSVAPAPVSSDRPPSQPLNSLLPVAENMPQELPPSRPRRRRKRSLGWVAFVLLFTLMCVMGMGLVINNPSILPANISGSFPPGWLRAPTATVSPTNSIEVINTTEATSPPTKPVPARTPTEVPTQTITPTPESTATELPSPTPIGANLGQIVFASDRSGLPQLYLMNADGSDQLAITNEVDGACQPSWSPDGMRIVYVSPCSGRKDTYPGSSLSIIHPDGTGRIFLPASIEGDFDPAWSPNGKYIAFTSLRDGYPQIYLIDLETYEVERLTKTDQDTQARQPDWSADGSQIVYTVRRLNVLQVWIMSSTGQAQEQLVRSGGEYLDFAPAWTSDGQLIFFSQTTLEPNSAAHLMSLRYEDRNTHKAVAVQADPPVVDVSSSPDSFWLAFESSDGQNQDIYFMTITGGNRTRLTTDPDVDFDPDWRPKSETP